MSKINEHLSKIGNHELMTPDLRDKLYAELDRLCPDRLSKDSPKQPPDNCLPIISQIAGRLYRLVISEAIEFSDGRRRKLELDDLVQEGVIGLLVAIWRFDNSRGYRISTYAIWWIKQYIGRAASMQGRTIRIPVHTDDELLKVDNFIKDHEKLNGERPTGEQIMDALELSPRKFRNLLRYESVSITPSLDAIYESDDNSHTLHTFLASNGNISDRLDLSLLEDQLDDFLSSNLTAREERIIRLRFGLVPDGKDRMLKEIGEKFGVTRERIRQIEKEALDKLRKASEAEVLREYL